MQETKKLTTMYKRVETIPSPQDNLPISRAKKIFSTKTKEPHVHSTLHVLYSEELFTHHFVQNQVHNITSTTVQQSIALS